LSESKEEGGADAICLYKILFVHTIFGVINDIQLKICLLEN